MAYNYEDQLKETETEDALCLMARIMISIEKLKQKGRVYASIGEITRLDSTDAWDTLMCVDNLLNNGFLKEVTNPEKTITQDRVLKL